MIRHHRRENSFSWLFHFSLIIPRVLVNLAKRKCGRGLAKDFTILQDSHTKSYETKSLLKMHQMPDFDEKSFNI